MLFVLLFLLPPSGFYVVYADDLAVIAETEDLIKRLNEWNNVENRGMRVTQHTTTHGPFSATTRVIRCQKKTVTLPTSP